MIRTLRREGVRCAALLLALAFAVGLARGGATYFYCPFMGAVVSEDCCAQDRVESSSVLRQTDCCEARTLGRVPVTDIAAMPWPQLGAPLLCVMAPLVDDLVGAPAPADRFTSRSGLSPPPARRSAQRVVLRT